MEAKFDDVNDCLLVTIDTPPTAEGLMSTLEESARSVPYVPDTNILYDVTRVDTTSIDRTMMDRFIAVRGRYPRRGSARIAILVSSEVAFGLGRMYQLLSEGLPQQIKVFYDRQKAEQWVRGSRAAPAAD